MTFKARRLAGYAATLLLLPLPLLATACAPDAGAPREAEQGDRNGDLPESGWHREGRERMLRGELEEAGAAFDRALRRDPGNAALWVDIARLRYRGGEHEQALQAVEQALKTDPGTIDAYLLRGQIARDADGLLASVAWFDRGLAIQPQDPELLMARAESLIDLGRVSAGLADLRRAIEIDPGADRAIFLQAVVAARGGDPALARRLLQRAAADQRESAAGRLLEGTVALELGEYALAAQIYDRLAHDMPDDPRVTPLLARALLRAGNYRELVARFGERARDANGPPALQIIVARALESLERRAEAGELLDAAARSRSFALRPIAPALPSQLARRERASAGLSARDAIREAVRNGGNEAALARAVRFLAAHPGSADALNLLGDAYLAAGQASRAVSAYRRAARIRQGWPLTSRLAAALLAEGQPGAAEKVVADYLRGGANDVEAVALLARIRAQRGDAEGTARLLDTIAGTVARTPQLAVLWSEAAHRLGLAEDASVWAWRAYALQPSNPEAIVAVIHATDDPALADRLREKLARLP